MIKFDPIWSRFCQQVLSTGFVNMFCQVNRFCQQVLSSQHVLSTCIVNMFCQQVLSTGFVSNFKFCWFRTKFSQTWKSKITTTTTKLCVGLRELCSQSKISSWKMYILSHKSNGFPTWILTVYVVQHRRLLPVSFLHNMVWSLVMNTETFLNSKTEPTATLLVLIDFCPVCSELLTLSAVY